MPNTDLFRDLDLKKRLLRFRGYNTLYVKDGYLELDRCKSERISLAFLATYENAKKNVSKFEAESANNPETSYLVDLVKLIENEKRFQRDGLVETQERTAIVMDSAPESVLAVLSREYGKDVLGAYLI